MNNIQFPPKQCIVVGGGHSIVEEGIPLGLWEKIRNKFTIGCNSSMFHTETTINTFVDRGFYIANQERIDNLPLVIIKEYGDLTKERENFFPFKSTNHYLGKENFFKAGKIYTSRLTGIWSLTISICIGATEIYCIGFDWSKKEDRRNKKTNKVITHYYQDDGKTPPHEGIGLTGFYDGNSPKQIFQPYLHESIKIYTVGKTNIKCLENIDYPTFFTQIKNSPELNQNELRKLIKQLIIKCRGN